MTGLEQAARCMTAVSRFCHRCLYGGGRAVPAVRMIINSRMEWLQSVTNRHLTDWPNQLPDMTGRVCPAPCEARVFRRLTGLDYYSKQWKIYYRTDLNMVGLSTLVSHASDGKSCGVGSGPQKFPLPGDWSTRPCTIFERDDRFGGLLIYGIQTWNCQSQLLNDG